jgi:allantoate deiminase
VRFTLDVRAGTAQTRDQAAGQIRQALEIIAERRGVGLTFRQSHDLPPSPCAPSLMARLENAVAAIGQPVRRLVSGAGHDAMMFADMTPTAMLFLRCKGGISHNPAESVTAEDADLALRALLIFIDSLAEDFDG